MYWGCAQQAFGQHTLQRSSIACNGATPPAPGGEAQLQAMLLFCMGVGGRFRARFGAIPEAVPTRTSLGEKLRRGGQFGSRNRTPYLAFPLTPRSHGVREPKRLLSVEKKGLVSDIPFSTPPPTTNNPSNGSPRRLTQTLSAVKSLGEPACPTA